MKPPDTSPPDRETDRVVHEGMVESLPRVVACLRAVGVDPAKVDDLTHDTVVAVCKSPDRYQPQRGTLPALMLQIARRLALRSQRKSRREPLLAEPDLLEGDERHGPQALLRDKENRELLSKLLAKLPPKQREVIELHYLEGRSFAEIAEAQGVSLETARKRGRLGLDALMQAAHRYEVQERRRGNDPLPMLLPFMPRARRAGAAQPMALVASALGGAIVTAILLIRSPSTVEAPSAASAAAVPAATTEVAEEPQAPMRPVPSAAAPPSAPPPTSSVRQETAPINPEVALLRSATRAVGAGRFEDAARLLDEHARRYPDSVHAHDRAELVRMVKEKKKRR